MTVKGGKNMGAGMPDKLWAIDFDGMIGGNGSYVECDGQVVMHQLISKEDTKVIVDWLQERVLAFYLKSNNGLFASDNSKKRLVLSCANTPCVREKQQQR
jgi:hydroxymethylpyrimidine pyrophosphatase-like HAD family hydrolase